MKEKQIEVIAKEIAYQQNGCIGKECSSCLAKKFCVYKDIAEAIYNAGYNKQEWISVKDRLPEEFVSVLGYMTDAGDFPPVRECYRAGGVFFFPALGDRHPVSHWMPLPEAPKGDQR